MNVQEAYNQWSDTYDSDKNRTRDLDQVVTQDAIGNWQCKSILEIGCGTGKNSSLLSNIGHQVHSLDFSEGMLRRAKDKLRSDNVNFLAADITKLWPCANEFADLVVCNLVLEHIENLSFVFSEAFRSLMEGGYFFICELHPFRQYQGTKARFDRDHGTTEIRATVHHLSDFLEAGEKSGLTLKGCKEWWHEEDQGKPPRLISFMFQK